MRWGDIAGHGEIVTMLRNMLSADRMPHAVLMAGPSGLGKGLTARVLAAALLCERGGDEACGSCTSCRQMSMGTHPDFLLLEDDGSSLKIDQIRQLQHDAALTPSRGRRRVVLLEGAERMTVQAANSLLKVLEEPPTETVFLLTAPSTHVLLETIVSRCRVMPFRPLPLATLTRLLTDRGYPSEAVDAAARLSGGRAGKALGLLAPEGLAVRDKAVELTARLPGSGPQLVWETAGGLDKREAQEIEELLEYILIILRDLLVIQTGEEGLVMNPDLLPRLRTMAADWRPRGLRRAIQAVTDARRSAATNANSRLTLEALLIKLLGSAKEG